MDFVWKDLILIANVNWILERLHVISRTWNSFEEVEISFARTECFLDESKFIGTVEYYMKKLDLICKT
jgi:hypothetical protein